MLQLTDMQRVLQLAQQAQQVQQQHGLHMQQLITRQLANACRQQCRGVGVGAAAVAMHVRWQQQQHL